MNYPKPWTVVCLLPVALGGVLILGPGCACCSSAKSPRADSEERTGFLLRTNYHGWENSIWMGNGQVEAIVVPAIGRVMQFRFAGEDDGPFWENEELSGRNPDPAAKTWFNFGGDKTWPSPQSHWGDIAPTNWPPPVGFDATAVEAKIDGWGITLVYPIDPYYGIRVTRRIKLGVDRPSMDITTHYEKVHGNTLEAGIWVISQLKDPLAIYARVPAHSIFPQSFRPITGKRPPSLEIQRQLLSLKRDPKESHKIGFDVGSLLWMGPDYVLKIDSPRIPYRDYPDGGTSAQVYTSADPLSYVELEMLNPTHQLRQGDRATQRVTYSLLRRTEVDPGLEAAKLLRP